MEKKIVSAGIAAIALFAILFTPQDSDIWIYFLIIAFVFGVAWFFIKQDD